MNSVKLLLACSVLVSGAVWSDDQSGDVEKHYVSSGRYGLAQVGPANEQSHPMQAIVHIKFGSDIATIGEAIEELLFGSGYDYRTPVGVEKVLQSQSMPAVLQQIGPVMLIQALELLGGEAWQVDVDELRKQVSYRLNDGYADQKASLAMELHQQAKMVGSGVRDDGQVVQSFQVPFASGKVLVPLDQTPIHSAVNAIKTNQAGLSGGESVSVRVTGISHSTASNGNADFAQKRADQVRQYLHFGGVVETLFQPNEISVKNHQPLMEAGAVIEVLMSQHSKSMEDRVSDVMADASESGAVSRDYELVFDIRREQTLESNLKSWVRLANQVNPGANYQLVWQYPNDVLIEADAVYYGTFETALEALIKEFHETTGKPIGLQLDRNVARIVHREAKK